MLFIAIKGIIIRMRKCLNCQGNIPNKIKHNGKTINTQRRKYCTTCSPIGSHNTSKIHLPKTLSKTSAKNYQFMNQEEKKAFNKKHYKESCKKRRDERKKDLVEIFGGKCTICGYDENIHNLHFHHLDPALKEFEVNTKNLSSKTWEKVLIEAKKCVLVCSHCHTNIHYPQGKNWKNK